MDLNINGWRISIYALSTATTVVMLLWVLKYSGYGIDFTDESFYLVWMANPFLYDVSLSQFGFIYHLLYRLLDGNVALLRQANVLITFGLGWSLCSIFIQSIAPDIKNKSISLHLVAAAIACSSLAILVFYSTWLPTPSYNSLTFQALLLAVIGLLWADKTTTRKSIAGWLIVGVAGWLTFMAKPSSAALLAPAVLIYLVVARNFAIKMVAIAIVSAVVLLVVSALVIDGSLLGFAERIKGGMAYGQQLSGGHAVNQIFRLDVPTLTDTIRAAILSLVVGVFILFFTTIILAWRFLSAGKNGKIAVVACAVLCFVFIAELGFGSYGENIVPQNFQYLSIVGLVLATLVAGAVCSGVAELKRVPLSQWSMMGLFAAIPYIYTFGSNANYWRAAASASIFWILAGLVVLGPAIRKRADWTVITPVALITQTATALLLYTGMQTPYRQPEALWLQDKVVEFGTAGSHLRVSADWAAYIENAKTLVRDAGFIAGTPIIDMSGQSPGTLYFFEAENIGQAWMIGGYSGSLTVAATAFKRVPCEKIAVAWILREIDGPKNIPLELLAMLGIRFPDDYRLVAHWYTVPGAGGYLQTYQQLLYAPKNSQSIYGACLAIRNKKLM